MDGWMYVVKHCTVVTKVGAAQRSITIITINRTNLHTRLGAYDVTRPIILYSIYFTSIRIPYAVRVSGQRDRDRQSNSTPREHLYNVLLVVVAIMAPTFKCNSEARRGSAREPTSAKRHMHARVGRWNAGRCHVSRRACIASRQSHQKRGPKVGELSSSVFPGWSNSRSSEFTMCA